MDAAPHVRFVVPSRVHAESQTAMGLLAFAYELVDQAEHAPAELDEIRRCIAWFERHVAVPDRFNRTRSKGWYRRETRGISWLRASATEAIAMMQRLA